MVPPQPRTRNDRLVWAAALAICGAALLFQWARAWLASSDLAWGWVLPPVSAYFFWQRWADRPSSAAPARRPAAALLWAAIPVALVLLPLARLAIEPFPDWPLIQWFDSALLLGLMLLLIASAAGWVTAKHFLFPLCFGLAALPWPAFVSVGAMGRLRAGLAYLIAGVLRHLGEPARASGTAIQVARGYIGIEDACGGIRSLQGAIVMALAIGELRRDHWGRRVGWLAIAIALALAGNAIRLGVLSWICARRGTAALELWHGRIDWVEPLITIGLLVILALFTRERPATRRTAVTEAGPAFRQRADRVLAWAAIAGVLIGETGTQAWFGRGAQRDLHVAHWSAQLPRALPSYREDDFTPEMQSLLGCDVHQLGRWEGTAGGRRAGYLIEWHHGQSAAYSVEKHNPDVCLPMLGDELVAVGVPSLVRLGSLELPFAVRQFKEGGETFFVYFLAWNITAGSPLSVPAPMPGSSQDAWFHNQWREVRDARRCVEARILAVAVFDVSDPAEADRAFHREMALIAHEE